MDREDAPLIVYGHERDGPVFQRLCPKCGRFLKFPQTIKWTESADGICLFQKLTCSRCGEVEPYHVGWAGDFYE